MYTSARRFHLAPGATALQENMTAVYNFISAKEVNYYVFIGVS